MFKIAIYVFEMS